MDIVVLTDHGVKIKEIKKIYEYLDLARVLKKLEQKGDTNNSWHARNSPQGTGKMTVGIGNQRKNQDHPDYSFVEIG